MLKFRILYNKRRIFMSLKNRLKNLKLNYFLSVFLEINYGELSSHLPIDEFVTKLTTLSTFIDMSSS